MLQTKLNIIYLLNTLIQMANVTLFHKISWCSSDYPSSVAAAAMLACWLDLKQRRREKEEEGMAVWLNK